MKLRDPSAYSEDHIPTVALADAQVGDYIKVAPGLGTWRVLSFSPNRLIAFLKPSWLPRPKSTDYASLDLRTGTLRTNHHNRAARK